MTYRQLAIKEVAFYTRDMHNTILDLQHILNTPTKPTLPILTETKHSHIKSIRRETPKEYTLINPPSRLHRNTN